MNSNEILADSPDFDIDIVIDGGVNKRLYHRPSKRTGEYNHRPEIEGGLLAAESSALLTAFFKARRR